MDRRRAITLGAWALATATVVLSVGIWVMAVTAAVLIAGPSPYWLVDRSVIALTAVVEVVLGLLILRRHPGHRIGWLLLWVALLGNQEGASLLYSYHALSVSPGSLPGGDVAGWAQMFLFAIGFPVYMGLLPLLYPTGRLPSPRWRPAVWILIAGSVCAMTGAFTTDIYPILPFESSGWATDPFVSSTPWIRSAGSVLLRLGLVFVTILVSLAAASVVVRYRQADRSTRLQLKWFAYFAVPVGLVNAIFFIAPNSQMADLLNPVLPYLAVLLDTAIAFGILRHRLYDIDLVISKTLVYGSLAVLIGTVYVAVVVGLGTLIGTNGKPNTALAILATTVVAVAFQPARERLQRLANRLVYGRRLTPLEAVTELGDSMSVADPERVVEQMANVVAEATGAERAEVWLTSAGALVCAATSAAARPGPIPPGADLGAAFPTASARAPIVDQEETLGVIVIYKEAGDALTPIEGALLDNLARQAAHGLRNRVLTESLAARVAEVETRSTDLAESRQRVVQAHDGERRRLERDIHDGAQQHLVALAVQLGLARSLASRDSEKTREAIRSLIQETGRARATLARLARGVYPATLTRNGVAAALTSEVSASPIPVRIDDRTRRRFSEEVEAAAFFCALEAIQNALKHARPELISVRLTEDAGLIISVSDDGDGFDPAGTDAGSGMQGMIDRIAALGGDVGVDSAPGIGTTVTGRIPTTEAVPA